MTLVSFSTYTVKSWKVSTKFLTYLLNTNISLPFEKKVLLQTNLSNPPNKKPDRKLLIYDFVYQGMLLSSASCTPRKRKDINIKSPVKEKGLLLIQCLGYLNTV